MTEVKSLFPALEPLLRQVHRPVQYVGGEANSCVKPWEDTTLRWVLSYPDAYEIGQPNQGLAVLYEIINGLAWAAAERSYTIWPDLASLMRSAGVPQFTLESHHPVRAYDIWGFSLATELGYTNVLEMLDLAGVPLLASERGSADPIVVAGGHCAVNPEPMAAFIDAFILGDGEQAVIELSELARQWKLAGKPGGRVGLLLRFAKTGRVYVPAFYDVKYGANGAIASITPNQAGVPERPERWVLTGLDTWRYPQHPIVPIAETVHERYSVEVFRGCTQGCRFCQAGMITRPVRERSAGVIAQLAACGLAATGYDEVGILSLSSADHSQISELVRGLADSYADTTTSLSLPSTRVDAFNIELATELSRNGRRSGLTFAPEGGTERLRAVINKNVSEADLISTVNTAFSQGWRSVKLYFMCGLPTETDEDVLAIADMAHRVIETGRQVSGQRDISCTISIGGFVPKPMTPFQWAAGADIPTLYRRMRALKDKVRADRSCGRAITVRYADAEPTLVEGLLSRGDRRVGAVIAAVWRAGGMFDGWREHFNFERWMDCANTALAGTGVDVAWYTTRERDAAEVLPWEHLELGLDRQWLWDDYQDSLVAASLPDCRWAGCNGCGVCPFFGVDIELATRAGGKHGGTYGNTYGGKHG
ncbi:MAG: TIGR03960 family B12-binding radical SAM protein [Propionibacteriaceae bacterium]|jgi:radical SAM family uncharacterized protein|nr:TIGR03960 family B12-binding radical SAM protein [Propionibacteriaceae bacterium]